MVTTPASRAPLELMAAQDDCETFTFPTGARIFSRGTAARSIHAVRHGIVELQAENGDRTCYRAGELFCYQDIVWHAGVFRSDAVALTPVEILRLDRLPFLNLLHNHPSLALQLIGQEHDRLREQRASGTCCY